MTHVRRIREKIEANPSHPASLVTAKGLGYKLVVAGVANGILEKKPRRPPEMEPPNGASIARAAKASRLRISRNRPSYSSGLTILVFFVDIALYIVFAIRDLQQPRLRTDRPPARLLRSPTTFRQQRTKAARRSTSFPTIPPQWLDQQNAWAMLVGNDRGSPSGATMRPQKSRITPTLKTTSQMPRARSTSKTTQHSSGRTVTMAPLSSDTPVKNQYVAFLHQLHGKPQSSVRR